MNEAPVRKDEIERLCELESFQILDTLRDPFFDEIVELATLLFGTPIAAVSLIDRNRQWFKASIGLSVTQTERSSAFCAHTIMGTKVFLINDATADARFSNNPLVIGEPKICFYAGAPLISSSGYALGALCVIDHKPREFSSTQEHALQILARQVIRHIEQFRNMKNMTEAAQLSGIAEIAVNLTHEINNPLSNIQARARILSDEAASGTLSMHSVLDHSQRILSVVERISKILKSLKHFKKNDPERRVMTSLSDLIDDAILACHERIQDLNVVIQSQDLIVTKVLCDPIQISQVLVNLFTNALDSIENQNEKWIRIRLSISDSSLKILITDSGPPIPRNILFRMFEPFFSTKNEKGTGIGLSLSREIMREYNGTLSVSLEDGHPCFTMQFPSVLTRCESQA